MNFSPKFLSRLKASKSVTVLTGAGTSAESGIPTFRDPGGIWEQFKPEELANIRAFISNPVLVQGWYRHRRDIVESSEPNPGHHALATLAQHFDSFSLITQNVDGLHQRAGSTNVIELHGNLTRNYCIDCRTEADDAQLAGVEEGAALACTECGGLIRPDVVWFGEMLPEDAINRANSAAVNCDVFLSIGTSSVVYPAAGLPLVASENGAYVVEINLSPSALSDQMNEVLVGKSGEILPALLNELSG